MMIIHQIWMQGENQIPDHLLFYKSENQKQNPDCTYMFWDQAAIESLITHYPKYHKLYHNFPYMHQQIDFAKYLILYHHGGFYLDMDSYCVKPLTQLIERYPEHDMLVSQLNCNQFENFLHCSRKICVNNGVIYANANSPILLKMLNHIRKHHQCVEGISKMVCIDQTTGPQMFTDLVIDDPSVKILTCDYLEPCFAETCKITENTYVIHHHQVSWFDASRLTKIMIYYRDHKEWLTMLMIVMIVSLVIIMLMVMIGFDSVFY